MLNVLIVVNTGFHIYSILINRMKCNFADFIATVSPISLAVLTFYFWRY